jgi:hypothetical protein
MFTVSRSQIRRLTLLARSPNSIPMLMSHLLKASQTVLGYLHTDFHLSNHRRGVYSLECFGVCHAMSMSVFMSMGNEMRCTFLSQSAKKRRGGGVLIPCVPTPTLLGSWVGGGMSESVLTVDWYGVFPRPAREGIDRKPGSTLEVVVRRRRWTGFMAETGSV